jgi:hypothetical protein
MIQNLITGQTIEEDVEEAERSISELFDYLDGPGKDAMLSFCDSYQIDGVRNLDRNLRGMVFQDEDADYIEVNSIYMISTSQAETRISFRNAGPEFNVIAHGNDGWIVAFKFMRRADPKKAPMYLGLQTKF